MRAPLILGIIGEKSSGKSVVFQYLKRKRGIYSGRTSDVLADILGRLHLDAVSRPNNLALAESLRATFGPDILPRTVLADAGRRQYRVIVIEGIRRLAELKPLRRMKNFRLLYITAPVEVRWKRANQRTKGKRDDDHVSLPVYKKIERTFVTEREIPKMGSLANMRIDNVGSRKELFQQVDQVLRKFTSTI